jgi:two-component system, OmpR family, alkaline phosphatase synthesis response regulator PhoP
MLSISQPQNYHLLLPKIFRTLTIIKLHRQRVNNEPRKIKIALIDDDVAVRYALKTLLSKLSKAFDVEIDLFSSSNGIEGLGNIYAVNPDVIVIDTTLPKYSGKEVIEFIVSHKNFSTKEVVVIHEDSSKVELPSHFKKISKQSPTFAADLTDYFKYLIKSFTHNQTNTKVSSLGVVNNAIHFANKSDVLMHDISTHGGRLSNLFKYIKWSFYQLIASFFVSLLFVKYGSVHDSNIEQKDKDGSMLRVKTYPTLITAFVSLLFLAIQFGLFVGGGMIIMGMEVQSIFALASNEKGVEFNSKEENKFVYDSSVIEFTPNGVQLKGKTEQVGNDVPAPTVEESTPVPTIEEVTPTVEVSPTEEAVPTATTAPEPTATAVPTATEAPAPTEEGVLGIEDEKLGESQAPTTITTYPAEKPSIKMKNGVDYTHLTSIIERSSVNSDASSVQDPSTFKNLSDTNITYQLSPDGDNWYYYSENESRWGKTQQEATSSNTIQEVNKNLDSYEETFGSGSLFMKIFLHSNGSKNVTLKEISVERDLSLITPVDNTLPVEPTAEEVIVGDLDFNKLEVEIFNAAYFNGNKVVRGKVLLKDKKVKAKYEITQEQLDVYEANIYYSASEGGAKELIGTTTLYINNSGEIEFTLIKPFKAGGFVSAEVVTKKKLAPEVTQTPEPTVSPTMETPGITKTVEPTETVTPTPSN